MTPQMEHLSSEIPVAMQTMPMQADTMAAGMGATSV